MVDSLIVTVLVLSIVEVSRSQCTQGQINGCINTFVQGGGISKDHKNIPILFTPNETANTFDNVCGARVAFQTCIDQFKDACVDSVKYSLQGIYGATEYMCSQSKDNYVTHSQCLGGSDNQAFSKMCLEVLDIGLTRQNWCQKVNNYFACIAQGAETHCNTQSSTYQFNVVSKMYLNQANSYSCSIEPANYSCAREIVVDCYTFFATKTGLSRDGNGIPIPFSTSSADADFDDLCVRFGDLKNCLAYKGECSNIGVQKTLEGVLDTFKYICDNKREYLSHTQCLGGSDNENDLVMCIFALNEGLSHANWCSKTSVFYHCSKTGAKVHCSAEAAEYQAKIYMKMYAKQAERYTCGAGGLFGTKMTVMTVVLITLIMIL